MILTFGAVVSLPGLLGGVLLPSLEADLLAVGPAGVVAELVVPRPAEGVAIAPVVVGGADEPVVEGELGVSLAGRAGSPLLAGLETLLDSGLADEGT